MVQNVEVLWTLHTLYTHTKYGSGRPFLKYIQGCTAWWLSYKEINDATSNLLPSDQPTPPPLQNMLIQWDHHPPGMIEMYNNNQ